MVFFFDLWLDRVLHGRSVQVHVCCTGDKQLILTKSHPTPVAISIPVLNAYTLGTTWAPWTSFSALVDESIY